MIEMSRSEIEALLDSEMIGRLAMAAANGQPYVIPMPYCWMDGALYLRLPRKGRKARILAENDLVCFEIDWTTCDMSNYASVLIEGRLVVVEDLNEKRNVRLCNDLKYRQLRGAGRKGHGRITLVADLALSKIAVARISGRKKEQAQPLEDEESRRYKSCPLCNSSKPVVNPGVTTTKLHGG